MNIKSLILTLAAIGMCAASAYAVPARRGARNFIQPDGSTISLQMIGDEYFHTLATPDGLAVAKGADGFYYYQSTRGISEVRASSDVRARSEAEKTFLAGNGADISVNALVKARLAGIKKARATRARKVGQKSQVPNSGTPRVPVLLVQYSDYKFKDADANKVFKNFFTSGEKSAHQYFVDQSNGKYNPQFDVYGPVTLPNKRAYYGGNDYSGNDKAVGEMVAVACQRLSSEINYATYDNDKDGECDVIIVLYAGDGEASSTDPDCEDAVWPCQWSLDSSDYGKSLTYNNTKINKFAVFNELNGEDLSKIDGIGTFCHEFSHCLGLPDFYDTQYGPHFGMGPWSLMDYGPYNDGGYTPLGYSAYEKAFMNWINIEEGKSNTHYTLPWLNQKKADTDMAVKLTNPADPDEYYILENRKCQGWDKFMYTEGLFIYHVTYSDMAWESNTVNDYDLQRMTPVPADNALKLDKITYMGETYYNFNEESILGDLWPYNSATELTDTSKPASKVNTGSKLGKPITDITRNADGTVSFWCMKTPLPAVSAPAGLSHSLINNTTASFSWNPPAEQTPVTYTLEVTPHIDLSYKLASSTCFDYEGEDWEADGYTEFETGNGIRLGSSKQNGMITSPSFTGDATGIVTTKIKAKFYSNDFSKMNVELLDENGKTLDSKTLTLTKAFRDFNIVFKGTPDSEMKISISTTAKKQRIYVYGVEIYTGDASDLQPEYASQALKTPNVSNGSDGSFLITGITSTTFTLSGLEPDGKYDYRLRAVPNDTQNWDASPWTETGQFDLSDPTGVEDISIPESDLEGTPLYYTLQGLALPSCPSVPGIYIVKTGRSTRKIIIH